MLWKMITPLILIPINLDHLHLNRHPQLFPLVLLRGGNVHSWSWSPARSPLWNLFYYFPYILQDVRLEITETSSSPLAGHIRWVAWHLGPPQWTFTTSVSISGLSGRSLIDHFSRTDRSRPVLWCKSQIVSLRMNACEEWLLRTKRNSFNYLSVIRIPISRRRPTNQDPEVFLGLVVIPNLTKRFVVHADINDFKIRFPVRAQNYPVWSVLSLCYRTLLYLLDKVRRATVCTVQH